MGGCAPRGAGLESGRRLHGAPASAGCARRATGPRRVCGRHPLAGGRRARGGRPQQPPVDLGVSASTNVAFGLAFGRASVTSRSA